MKEKGTVYKGPAQSKPGVVLLMSDDTFSNLSEGKVCFLPFSDYFLSPDLAHPHASYSMCITGTGPLLPAHLHTQLDGQKAFMTGKLKTKGNAMLAIKLTPLLEVRLYIFVMSFIADNILFSVSVLPTFRTQMYCVASRGTALDLHMSDCQGQSQTVVVFRRGPCIMHWVLSCNPSGVYGSSRDSRSIVIIPY